MLVGVQSLWWALAGCCEDVSVSVCHGAVWGRKEELVMPADSWLQ